MSHSDIVFQRKEPALRSILLIIVAAIVMGYTLTREHSKLIQTTKTTSEDLEGAYEFVSEVTVLTKPVKSIDKRDNTTWSGQWLFYKGRFSQTLMNTKREPFLALPKMLEALGFESSAGSYEIKGTYMELTSDLALHPVNVGRPTNVEYHFNGDTLTLKEELRPRREDISEGSRTTVLKRIR